MIFGVKKISSWIYGVSFRWCVTPKILSSSGGSSKSVLVWEKREKSRSANRAGKIRICSKVFIGILCGDCVCTVFYVFLKHCQNIQQKGSKSDSAICIS